MPEDLIDRKIKITPSSRKKKKAAIALPKNAIAEIWQVGDRVLHNIFGEGEITHDFGTGKKTNIAIKFPELGQKIIDPKVAKLEKLN